MATDVHRIFHETWLGECQPAVGLTFSVPVLCDAGVMQRLAAVEARRFVDDFTELVTEHLSSRPSGAEGSEDETRSHARLADLRKFLLEFCGWTEAELHGPDRMPDDLVLRIAEEGTELRPTFAIPYGNATSDTPLKPTLAAGEQTPASRAGAAYQLLVWDLPAGLALDTSESETTTWHYPPAAKFERLLRETRVPVGLLCNADHLRLLSCPPGGATGSISFPIAYMATPAGRDMLSAVRELLHADRVMGAMPGTPTTLELLELSRDRQADVTNRLGQQALEALQILLEGFEAAGHRDGDDVMREAMRQHGNHVYEGLLTVVLRLIFTLYAEDRELLPSNHPVYAAHLSVAGLHDALVTDADTYGDTMDQRFGAWPRLIMLFRALYFGLEHSDLEHGDFSLPPHRGKLFNPEHYSFLEGWMPGGAAPTSAGDRASTRIPSISDGVVLRVLRRLLYLDGQRLSYSALEEEQLGSVYEGLMGFAIERRMSASICLAPSRVWLSPADLLSRPRATRVRFLKDAGVDSAPAKRLCDAVEKLEDGIGAPPTPDSGPLELEVLATLRDFSIAPKRKHAHGREPLTAEVGPDRLVIQPGEERRRTSSHYTPRSLSGPIVQRTLEPLLAAITARVAREQPDNPDPQPSAHDLLQLKICDPAMGSGAFLVESCRFLASHLVAAWVREGTLERELAQAGDDQAQRKPEQLARRMVAQSCLFGVDKNPLAVELGKLSLWLLTLARGQTFTFLDHCLKAGDSLVGLSRAQILALDWSPELGSGGAVAKLAVAGGQKKASKASKKPSKKSATASASPQLNMFEDMTRRAFDKATRLRQQLAELARDSDRDDVERQQHDLHVEAERAVERLRDVADIVLSTYFFPFDTPEGLSPEFLFSSAKVTDKQRRDCLARVADQLNIWLMGTDRLPRGLELRRELIREGIRPMHWELEFPEVFSDERADPLMEDGIGRVWVDAVVGNPPFMGGKQVSSNFGDAYGGWLGLTNNTSRNADISALFFRCADRLLGAHGTIGLISTNTIAQGDTREAGLGTLIPTGSTIYHATRDMAWPVRGANVNISVVHLAKGCAALDLPVHLDGCIVQAINSQLRESQERSNPNRLAENQGRGFVGSFVLGKGFTLTPEERCQLALTEPRNNDRMFPYLGGQELNTSPTQMYDRFVIDFGEMGLAEADRWPDLVAILRERVKPERDKLKDNADGRRYKAQWWKFGRPSTSLRTAIAHLSRCLACSRHSKHVVFAFQPTDRVFSEALIVFALPEYAHFGLLQSRIHERWARVHGSSMRNDLRYTPSDCFETFAFPHTSTLATDTPLEAIAKRLYETRAGYMLATDQGLTKTYNALTDPTNDDPEIVHLRDLHEQLDRAVLDAYDQPDIAVPPYAGATPEQLEQFEDAVLDFLFARNTLLAS